MALFAPLTMNTIVNDRRGDHQPQPEEKDEAAGEPVTARDEHGNTHVGDEQTHSDRKDEADLRAHKAAHAPSLIVVSSAEPTETGTFFLPPIRLLRP